MRDTAIGDVHNQAML